ncbi:hypothetical protein [Halosimplex sp. J119]
MIAQNQSVIAQVNGSESYVDGSADGAILPGTGVEWYRDADGDVQVRQVGADSKTKRVAREQRNPPRSLGSAGESPLDDPYDSGNDLETVGFRRHDRARLRKSSNASADPTDAEAAWDQNGKITDAGGTVDGTNSPSEFVGRVVEEIARSGEDNLLVVEFY